MRHLPSLFGRPRVIHDPERNETYIPDSMCLHCGNWNWHCQCECCERCDRKLGPKPDDDICEQCREMEVENEAV